MLRRLSLPRPTNLLATQFADPVGKLFESEINRDSQSSHLWSHSLIRRHEIKWKKVNILTVLYYLL